MLNPASPSHHTRRFPRAQLERPVYVRLVGESQPWEAFGKTRVMGAGGCMLELEKSPGLGSFLELLISLDELVIKTDSHVVWETTDSRGQHRVGVEFLRVAEDDRGRIRSLVAEAGRGPGRALSRAPVS